MKPGERTCGMPSGVHLYLLRMRVLLLSIKEVCVIIRPSGLLLRANCGVGRRDAATPCYLWDDSFDVFLCPALALVCISLDSNQAVPVQLQRNPRFRFTLTDRAGICSSSCIFQSHGALHSKCTCIIFLMEIGRAHV